MFSKFLSHILDAAKHNKKPLLIILILFGIIILLSFVIFVRGIFLKKEKLEATGPETRPVSVVTQKIIPITMTDRIDLPAEAHAWENLLIKAEVTGKVIAVHVKEGDHVQKNQLLVQIDPRDYENRLRSLDAQLTLANANFERLQALVKKNAVAQADYDQAVATLNNVKASRQTAALNLERCSIKASFDGIINDLPARHGMLLSHGDPVAQLLDIKRLKIEVSIPEAEVAAVRKIDSAMVRFTALDSLAVEGKKIFLSSKPLTTSLVYTLRLEIPNINEQILPGMFGRVDIIKETYPDSIGIPLFTVISENNTPYVYVIEDDMARKRMVHTGFLEGWKIYVKDGLHESDQVVIVGHRSLEDGQKVTIIQSVVDPGELYQ